MITYFNNITNTHIFYIKFITENHGLIKLTFITNHEANEY